MSKSLTTIAAVAALIVGAAILCACGKKTNVYAPQRTTVVRPASHSTGGGFTRPGRRY